MVDESREDAVAALREWFAADLQYDEALGELVRLARRIDAAPHWERPTLEDGLGPILARIDAAKAVLYGRKETP